MMLGVATSFLHMKPIFSLFLLSLVLVMRTDGAPDLAEDDHNVSQSELNQRAYAEFQRTDAELTKTFEEQLKTEQSPALREALIASQRAWKTFREADAHYESVSGEGGSARSYYVNKRMTHLTKQRIYQLKTPFAAGWAEPPTAPAK